MLNSVSWVFFVVLFSSGVSGLTCGNNEPGQYCEEKGIYAFLYCPQNVIQDCEKGTSRKFIVCLYFTLLKFVNKLNYPELLVAHRYFAPRQTLYQEIIVGLMTPNHILGALKHLPWALSHPVVQALSFVYKR
jgi:hypothetical protein